MEARKSDKARTITAEAGPYKIPKHSNRATSNHKKNGLIEVKNNVYKVSLAPNFEPKYREK